MKNIKLGTTIVDNSVSVYVNGAGELRCVENHGCIQIPEEFSTVLPALAGYLALAQECIELLGGIPKPVAQAILRNLEPARAALDLALRGAHRDQGSGVRDQEQPGEDGKENN